jgi:hypothetical protein
VTLRDVIVGGTGFGASTYESVTGVLFNPSMSSSTFMLLLPGPAVMWYPANTDNRSLVVIVTLDGTVH